MKTRPIYLTNSYYTKSLHTIVYTVNIRFTVPDKTFSLIYDVLTFRQLHTLICHTSFDSPCINPFFGKSHAANQHYIQSDIRFENMYFIDSKLRALHIIYAIDIYLCPTKIVNIVLTFYTNSSFD